MQIHVDDLGDGFSVRALNAGNDFQTTAQAGRFTVRPGVYLLQRQDVVTEHGRTAPLSAHVRLDEFVALPESTTSWVVRHEPPTAGDPARTCRCASPWLATPSQCVSNW